MDLAAENGGNCSLTKPDEMVDVNGVMVDGTINLAGTTSVHASQLYSKNVSAFILHGYALFLVQCSSLIVYWLLLLLIVH